MIVNFALFFHNLIVATLDEKTYYYNTIVISRILVLCSLNEN